MAVGERMDWAGPVTQLVTAALALFAFWKARSNDKTDRSAKLVEVETKARESLARRYEHEMTRCTHECEELRKELNQERKLRRELEHKFDAQERELQRLKLKLGYDT